MLGVSLPYRNGLKLEIFDGCILDELKSHNVESIELRTVRLCDDAATLSDTVKFLHSKGFNVTIHGDINSPETAENDIFLPLAELLNNLNQKELIVTVHPINGDNVKVMQRLSEHIKSNALPVRIALENNRYMPDKTYGDSLRLVTDTVNEVNSPEIGICFDFGHYAWYTECSGVLPPKEFSDKIIHTHIHALNEKGTTHFPLGYCKLPLNEYVSSFSPGYYGAYNIELDFPRFDGVYTPTDALLKSADTLYSALPEYSILYDDLRRNFTQYLEDAFEIFNDASTDSVSLIQSSSYLFRSGGINCAMDVSLRNAGEITDCLPMLKEKMKNVELMLITHLHVDHFEYTIVNALKDTDIKWIIPDFMVEDAINYGLNKDNIITAYPNTTIKYKTLTILPFKSSHYRPFTNNGVPETGYFITPDNTPSLLFPGDIRNYDLSLLPKFNDVDAVFAHIWFGDDNTDTEKCKSIAESAAEFYLGFKPKKIFFGHLYESGRNDTGMWRKEHAEYLEKLIKQKSPETENAILSPGKKYELKRTPSQS